MLLNEFLKAYFDTFIHQTFSTHSLWRLRIEPKLIVKCLDHRRAHGMQLPKPVVRIVEGFEYRREDHLG
jgi:hypothetical protein